MANYCAYKDCENMQRSFASITFFNLPTDDRREIWIKNSGNEKLKNLDASLRRVFCEYHFDPKYLRRQFNRTILRRDAVPYPYDEAPASQEVEYIELAESEEDPEQSQSEATESSNEENKVVVVLNKSKNTQLPQTESAKVIIKRTSDAKIINLKKDVKRKPVKEAKDEEIDFIVLEEISQEPTEHRDDSLENEESEPNSSKKMRLETEQPAHQPNKPSQAEKVKEAAIEQPTTRKISEIRVPVARSSTDGIVSSTETVDANNEETYFALSLVGILKRLPPHKRAIAKCHILSYLTELEYGSSSIS